MVRNYQKPQHKIHFKAIWWTLLVLVILNTSLISAFEFDNVKDYNEETKTITITNAFGLGDIIAEIQLISPQTVLVFRGEDRKVAEFKITTFENYESAFTDMNFYNINDNLKQIQRNFNYKYENQEDNITINDYEESCETIIDVQNNSYEYEKCTKVLIGTHEEEVFEWKAFNKNTELQIGEFKLGIFTDVQAEESVEWIPTLFGVEINEFAAWNETFNVDLIHYYSFDDDTKIGNNIPDLRGGDTGIEEANGTLHTTAFPGGILGQSMDTQASQPQNVSLSNPEYFNFLNTSFPYTLSIWLYPDEVGDGNVLIQGSNDIGFFTLEYTNTGTMNYYYEDDESGRWRVSANYNMPENDWTHYVFINYGCVNTKECVDIFINGTNLTSQKTLSLAAFTNPMTDFKTLPFTFGSGADFGDPFEGYIDEVGFWNRTLTLSEAVDLYNDGSGMTYVYFPADTTPPNVINNTPLNQTYGTANINFNVTATDSSNTVSSCLYTLNGGTDNYTMTNVTADEWTHTNSTMFVGSHRVNFYCNDSYNNWNMTESVDFNIETSTTITLITPIDYFNTSSVVDDFNFNITTPLDWVNYTFRVWDSADVETKNRVVINGTPDGDCIETWYDGSILVECLGQGINTDDTYEWNVLGCLNSGKCAWSTSNYTFTHDSTSPIVNIAFPTNMSYNEEVVDINITFTETSPDSCWYSNDSGVTNSSRIDCTTNFSAMNFGQGSRTIVVYMNDTLNNQNESDPVTFFVDTINPNISITTPINYINSTDFLLDINYTYSDANVDSCWYTINDGVTNNSLTCGNNLTSTNWGEGDHEIFIYINDTSNNINSSSINFSILLLLENYQTYSDSTIEGTSETFTINFTYPSAFYTNLVGYLVYNNVNYTGTLTSDGDYGLFTRTLSIPLVTSDTNVPFNWSIAFINDTYNYRSSNTTTQLVTNLDMGTCGVWNVTLLNLTLLDEETQDFINGTTYNTSIEVNIEITPIGSSTPIINFSENFSEIHNASVCIGYYLNDSTYQLNALIHYVGDSYASEFYNIQNLTLTNSSLPIKINLYDLKDADNQPYQIIYKDENFRPVSNALIQIQRKYIDEGQFKTVEIPKTNPDGTAIGNLVSNSIIYTFIVTKNNQILATFNNVKAICQIPSLSNCQIVLNSYSTSSDPEDFTVLDDFSFTMDYNEDTRTITSVYTIPSGNVGDVNLNVTMFDNLGTTSVCDTSLVSSSGTLICTLPIALGNGTAISKLTKDGIFMGQGWIRLSQEPEDIYGSNLVFLGVFLMLTLIGVSLGGSPIIVGIFLILGIILAVTLNLVDATGFIGKGATILWIIIAIIIIIIKGSNRE